MTEEQLNNTENPLCGFAPPCTLEQAIQSINRLLWSDNVEDDDHADAEVVKSFLVNDNMQEIAQKKMYKDRVSKTTPVMETTIEGAQKRIIDFVEFWSDNADFRGWDKDADIEYIAVFLDTVGDEMAAITSSCNSLHDRYVEALASMDQLQDDWNTVDAEAANHLADKIELKKEIAEWKDNFEAADMESQRHFEEKMELQKEIAEWKDNFERLCEENKALHKANLNNLHAADDNR